MINNIVLSGERVFFIIITFRTLHDRFSRFHLHIRQVQGDGSLSCVSGYRLDSIPHFRVVGHLVIFWFSNGNSHSC